MKILIAEDDFIARTVIQDILAPYGTLHVASNGKEAVTAFRAALDSGQPYDLVCLDIRMPVMNGHEALREMREIEAKRGLLYPDCSRIIVTSAMHDSKNVLGAFRLQCDAYVVKPVSRATLLGEIKKLSLSSEGFPRARQETGRKEL